MVRFDEDKVRELVEEAVRIARTTTPGNVSDEAVVQWTMDDKFIDGRWRSTYFLDQEAAIQAALDVPMPERSIDEWAQDVGHGWGLLVRGLDANLREIDPEYRIGQVKEKFGGLRYYIDAIEGNVELANKLVRIAEDASFKICEDCGGPGERYAINGFWIKTLCPRCIADREDEREFKEALANGELEFVADDD